MKDVAVEVLRAGEGTKVLDSLWALSREQFDEYVSQGGVDGGSLVELGCSLSPCVSLRHGQPLLLRRLLVEDVTVAQAGASAFSGQAGNKGTVRI